jgi:hypothetical protein
MGRKRVFYLLSQVRPHNIHIHEKLFVEIATNLMRYFIIDTVDCATRKSSPLGVGIDGIGCTI